MSVPRWQLMWMDNSPHDYNASLWTEGGTLFGAHDTVIEVRLNGTNSITFSMNGLHPDNQYLTEMAMDLLLKFQGEDLLRTRLVKSTDNIGHTRHGVNYTAYDYKELFKRRMVRTDVDYTASGLSPQEIAFDLINDYAVNTVTGTLGIFPEPVGTTPGFGNVIALRDDSIWSIINTQLIEIDGGFDWEINPAMRLVTYYPQQGETKDTTLKYPGNIISFSRNFDPAEYSNHVIVKGKSPVREIANSFSTPSGYGIWDTVISAGEYEDGGQAQSRADREIALREVNRPTYSITLQPNAWTGPDFCWLGDVVNLKVKSGRLNFTTTQRVYGLTIRINDNGGDQATIYLGNYPGTTTITKSNMDNLRRLNLLER